VSAGGKRLTRTAKLEELAKLRYALLYDPLLVHASPKALWTHQSDGGVYEKSFGIDGELAEAWPDEVFEETLLALAFYLRAE
jgi:hypothetical protein